MKVRANGIARTSHKHTTRSAQKTVLRFGLTLVRWPGSGHFFQVTRSILRLYILHLRKKNQRYRMSTGYQMGGRLELPMISIPLLSRRHIPRVRQTPGGASYSIHTPLGHCTRLADPPGLLKAISSPAAWNNGAYPRSHGES